MTFRWLNLLAALALPAAAASQGDARPIALDEAIKLAQQNAPTAIAARNTLRTGQSAIRQQILGYLPTLGLSTGATQRGGEQFVNGIPVVTRGDTAHWSYTRSITIPGELRVCTAPVDEE